MTHTAFNLYTLTDKHPFKIECIDTWQNTLVVGTSEGFLLAYEIIYDEFKKSYKMEHIIHQKSSSKKPVTQVTVVEEQNILLSLSDNHVCVHNLAQNFNVITQLPKTKGCLLYSIDKTGNQLKICAAMKKRLIIFSWVNKTFVEVKELSIPDQVKSLVWCGSYSLCVGFKKEYNLIDIQTGGMVELFPVGKSGAPIATVLPDDQIVLGREHISIFLGSDGKPTKQYGMSWSELPVALGFCFPYIIALLSKTVEIKSIFLFQSLVQQIPLLAPRCICSGNVRSTFNPKGFVYIASKTQVWVLTPVALHTQINQLVESKSYEEALGLLENVSSDDVVERDSTISKTRVLYAYHLFKEGQYPRAMDYFYNEKVDPLYVIGIFPKLLPAYYTAQNTYEKQQIELDPQSKEKALAALIGYLTKKRQDLKLSYPDDVNYDEVSSQTQKDWNQTQDIAQIVDTTLVKAYLATNDSLVPPLLRLPNQCHIKETEQVLRENHKFSEMVILYKMKGKHKEALDLLKEKSNQPKEQLSGTRPTINYLKELGSEHMDLIINYSAWVLQQNSKEGLEIFVTDRKPEHLLPSKQVVDHLKKYAPDQVIPYLEFAVQELSDQTPELHNELIIFYFNRVFKYRESAPKTQGIPIGGTEDGPLGPMRAKLINFLEDSRSCYSPNLILSNFHKKLLEEGLYEERAILLSKLGNHEEALKEYVHRLFDFKKAEDYCRKHYHTDTDGNKDVYLSLLRVYLSKPDKSMMEDPAKAEILLQKAAFSFLDKYYKEIDVLKALDLLQDTTKIDKLYKYFESVLRDITERRRDCQVHVNVLKSESMKIKRELIRYRSGVVHINDETYCSTCDRLLGNAVPVRYPNGTIVHYKCFLNNKKAKK
eukprot:TRINITY_DN7730_c0_g1_i1.p1 TRINITY_DN7730_c0_g1~~TRINITY_DN7730_c0_g1_i1.p1  ORF type:complete len:877 (+),score=183.62 TRINITY_DN7730_c0_g1_i1:97-2727(+)